jgi:hypothetical protein
VDAQERVALLLQQSSEHIFQLVPLDSKIYVLANNPCYFGLLLTEQRLTGEYVSPVLDARTLASWGRVVWDAAVAGGASVQLQSRSGNTSEPNATWSDWSPFYGKTKPILSQIPVPQIKVLLPTGQSSPSSTGQCSSIRHRRGLKLKPAAERDLPQLPKRTTSSSAPSGTPRAPAARTSCGSAPPVDVSQTIVWGGGQAATPTLHLVHGRTAKRRGGSSGRIGPNDHASRCPPAAHLVLTASDAVEPGEPRAQDRGRAPRH